MASGSAAGGGSDPSESGGSPEVSAGAAASAPASDPAFAGDADSAFAPTEPTPVPPSDEERPAPAPQSGLLTAGAWDDNLNFERFSDYRDELLQDKLDGAPPFKNSEHSAAHERFEGEREAHSSLDISLVIDTTGSMADEIRYLQTEFRSLAATIAERYPDAEQHWSLVVYRDEGDSYVTRPSDFTADVETFRELLGKQMADGGGDFPEAPDAAFAAMNELEWRSEDSTARLSFWVADAPHHSDRAEALADAVRAAADRGVHIYPVASSGIDELTELTMRSAAQLTGGRYLFLTDDSGVGGAHKEPSTPCYFVTRLDHAILRMIDIEMTGKYREPAAKEVIRTGGDPEDGACTLESGDQVTVF